MRLKDASRKASSARIPSDVRAGVRAAAEAMRAGRARQLWINSSTERRGALAALAEEARRAGIPVRLVPAESLDHRAGSARHQGVLALVAPFSYSSLDDLLALDRDEPPLLLALDGVEDPQNLGSVLRSVDAAGAHGVILPERRAAPVTPAVARASAGALDHVPIAHVVNLPRALDHVKERGLWVYGLDMSGTEAYDEADYNRPLMLVAGAEGKGISRLVREQCDVLVRIPLHGHVASLNVSVACALALFAARRARERR